MAHTIGILLLALIDKRRSVALALLTMHSGLGIIPSHASV